jgi:hypothetical protein
LLRLSRTHGVSLQQACPIGRLAHIPSDRKQISVLIKPILGEKRILKKGAKNEEKHFPSNVSVVDIGWLYGRTTDDGDYNHNHTASDDQRSGS